MSKEMVTNMEESRCRVAAMSSEDLRCSGLMVGVMIEKDPRYKDLHYGTSTEMEDPRCRIAMTEMEDPRCKGMNWTW